MTEKKIHFIVQERHQRAPLCGPPWIDHEGNPTWIGTNDPGQVTCLLCQRALAHRQPPLRPITGHKEPNRVTLADEEAY